MADHDHRHGIYGCRACAEIAADDSRRIEAERASEEAASDEIATLRAAVDAERETIAALRRELEVARSHGASGDVALACRAEEVTELRRELADCRDAHGMTLRREKRTREELVDVREILASTRADLDDAGKELAARTEERDAARKALRVLLDEWNDEGALFQPGIDIALAALGAP